ARPPAPAQAPTATPASASNTMTIDITIANGKTTPSGEKINVPVGEKVILNVTSDTDDEVHAHIGGPGYELEVKAGTPAKGEFTIDSPGSFEVESHHLEKIIVILNARSLRRPAFMLIPPQGSRRGETCRCRSPSSW